MEVEAFTDQHAIGAALSCRPRDTFDISQDLSKQHKVAIGSSTSKSSADSASSKDSSVKAPRPKAKENETRKTPIAIDSSASPSSSSSSKLSLSSSSLSSSSSHSSNSDKSHDTKELMDKLNVVSQDLVNDLMPASTTKNNTPSTKNSDTTDATSGHAQAPADYQPSSGSGSRRAHVPPSAPSGTAGNSPKAAGLGV
jgi:hypothetical protein